MSRKCGDRASTDTSGKLQQNLFCCENLARDGTGECGMRARGLGEGVLSSSPKSMILKLHLIESARIGHESIANMIKFAKCVC